MSNTADARPVRPPFFNGGAVNEARPDWLGARQNKVGLVAIYAACYALLATIYVHYTSPVWGYTGLQLLISPIRVMISLMILFSFVIAIPSKWSVRTFFLNIIVTTYLLPSMILYAFSGHSFRSVFLICLALAIVYAVSAVNIPRLRIASLRPAIMAQVLLVTSAVVVLIFILFGGFRNFNLDFAKVYDFRESASEALPGFFEYLSSLFTKAVIPFGIAISLWHKRYIGVAAFTLISVLFFGLTSHKGMAIIPFLSIAVFMVLSRRRGYATLLSFFAAFLVFLALAIAVSPDMGPLSFWGQLENLFVRRSLFIPALIDYNYIELFSNGDKYFWSTSKLTLGLVRVPYNGLSMPLLVGSYYFGGENSANTGFIGSGFAQAGVIGVIIYSVGVGLVIGFFQSCSRYMGVPLVASGAMGVFMAMVQSTDFVALFLTNGLLPALLILACLNPGGMAPERGVVDRGRSPAGGTRANRERFRGAPPMEPEQR